MPTSQNDLNAATQPSVPNTPSGAIVTPPVSPKPFDKGVVTTEDILTFQSHVITKGKNIGQTRYLVTTVGGTEIWATVPPAVGETRVSYGKTATYNNFIGYSSFSTLSLEAKYAKATSLARANAIACAPILADSASPEAMASLLRIDIKDLL